MNARLTDAAVISDNGHASMQHVALSINGSISRDKYIDR